MVGRGGGKQFLYFQVMLLPSAIRFKRSSSHSTRWMLGLSRMLLRMICPCVMVVIVSFVTLLEFCFLVMKMVGSNSEENYSVGNADGYNPECGGGGVWRCWN